MVAAAQTNNYRLYPENERGLMYYLEDVNNIKMNQPIRYLNGDILEIDPGITQYSAHIELS